MYEDTLSLFRLLKSYPNLCVRVVGSENKTYIEIINGNQTEIHYTYASSATYNDVKNDIKNRMKNYAFIIDEPTVIKGSLTINPLLFVEDMKRNNIPVTIEFFADNTGMLTAHVFVKTPTKGRRMHKLRSYDLMERCLYDLYLSIISAFEKNNG